MTHDNVQFLNVLSEGLKVKARELFEKKKQELIEELDRNKAEYIASVVLQLERNISVRSSGEELVITVRTR